MFIAYVDLSLPQSCRFANRLTGIKENEKFQKKKDDHPPGLKHVVDEAKEHHNVKYVHHSTFDCVFPFCLFLYSYENNRPD